MEKDQEHNPLYILRDILLEDDRDDRNDLRGKVEDLDLLLNDSKQLKEKVDPILEDQIVYLKNHFPQLFGQSITDSIRFQIKNSQNEVVEALYPVIGKLIRRYISREIEVLSEKIDNQVNAAFSWESWVRRIKAWFGIAKQGELILQTAMEAEIKQIFVIEQGSGVLVGNFSKEQNVDEEMVAGMLTAIKAFVNDAISENTEDLESIEYDAHKILIRDFHNFYIAVVAHGVINASFKQRLDELTLEFYEKVLKRTQPKGSNAGNMVSRELEEYFGY